MSAPIDLLATFIPNEGEFFRVKLALEIAIDEVVTEPGCIRYELTEANAGDAIVLAFLEQIRAEHVRS